jgi:hypothetical protein
MGQFRLEVGDRRLSLLEPVLRLPLASICSRSACRVASSLFVLAPSS